MSVDRPSIQCLKLVIAWFLQTFGLISHSFKKRWRIFDLRDHDLQHQFVFAGVEQLSRNVPDIDEMTIERPDLRGGINHQDAVCARLHRCRHQDVRKIRTVTDFILLIADPSQRVCHFICLSFHGTTPESRKSRGSPTSMIGVPGKKARARRTRQRHQDTVASFRVRHSQVMRRPISRSAKVVALLHWGRAAIYFDGICPVASAAELAFKCERVVYICGPPCPSCLLGPRADCRMAIAATAASTSVAARLC